MQRDSLLTRSFFKGSVSNVATRGEVSRVARTNEWWGLHVANGAVLLQRRMCVLEWVTIGGGCMLQIVGCVAKANGSFVACCKW